MPLLKVYTSANPSSQSATEALLKPLSRELAQQLGKPESYVMTCMMPQVEMTFGGDAAPSAYVEVKSIGVMAPATTAKISATVCATLSKVLDVPANRIYIEFQDAKPHLWGFNGGTFA